MRKLFCRTNVVFSRFGGLSLLLLGVHSAADFFNRTAFRLVDSVDLAIDQVGWAVFHKLGSLSVLSSATAERVPENLARWVDLSEKEVLASISAVVVELGCVVFLADFAWGHREGPAPPPVKSEPTFKNDRYRRVFYLPPPPPPEEPKREPSPYRVEPVAVVATLVAFTTSGLFFLAVTVENVFFRIFEPYPAVHRYIIPVGAMLGILLGALCLARFWPEMLLGAYRKSMARIGRAFEQQTPPAQTVDDGRGPKRWVKLLPRYVLCDTRRGLLVAVVLLPLGIVSLVASIKLNGLAIWASLGSML